MMTTAAGLGPQLLRDFLQPDTHQSSLVLQQACLDARDLQPQALHKGKQVGKAHLLRQAHGLRRDCKEQECQLNSSQYVTAYSTVAQCNCA